MKIMKQLHKQLEWLRSGCMGCMFGTVMAKDPEKIGWHFQVNPKNILFADGCCILSCIFPESDARGVLAWALDNGFFIEELGDYIGLRYRIGDNIAWVQYFGPDSHVATRQSPYPMLTFTVALPSEYYYKVGFTGILHLAHASVKAIGLKARNLLWDRSHKSSRKIIGHELGLAESAKVTFIKQNV